MGATAERLAEVSYAGETSQYEPRLFENTTPVEPPATPEGGYHLTEDLADKAIDFIRTNQTSSPDQPMFIYFTPGAVHGPHQVATEWADRYAGRFDGGWEALREETVARQREQGWIPEDAELTPIDPTMQRWEDVPEDQRRFQTRRMEIYAVFLEHTDAQYGKVLDELERLGPLDNTLVFYIFSDNGASAEGMNGTIAELLAQNGIVAPVEEQIEVLERDYGGLEALGTPLVDNMYHNGWAWAGDTPFRSTKLVTAHFGGTRTPMVIHWPGRIAPDPTPRPQIHHVNDVAATIYDALGIEPPHRVDGVEPDPLDGVSMAATFDDVGTGRVERSVAAAFTASADDTSSDCRRGSGLGGYEVVGRHPRRKAAPDGDSLRALGSGGTRPNWALRHGPRRALRVEVGHVRIVSSCQG